MTLADSLLEKLEAMQPMDGKKIISYSLPSGSVSLSVERADSVGCLLNELNIRRLSQESIGSVKPWADRLANRITGLIEPLKVIEVDDERNEAILRSQTPSKKGTAAHYYELYLNGHGSANLHRYKIDLAAGTKREMVPFSLTHESIAKLAGDICEI